jgi:hypothetical protein
VVRPGRCPTSGSRGSQQFCNSDPECPNDEKCCNSKCATVVTIGKHDFSALFTLVSSVSYTLSSVHAHAVIGSL